MCPGENSRARRARTSQTSQNEPDDPEGLMLALKTVLNFKAPNASAFGGLTESGVYWEYQLQINPESALEAF
jgi:hypothetical protein